MQVAGIIILVVTITLAAVLIRKKKPPPVLPLPENYRRILEDYVAFYKELDIGNRSVFENRIQLFLSRVRITGINTTVEDLDTVFIASSAIIPIFGFPDWEYMNLNEVLLYPDSFNHEQFSDQDRNTLGVVGTGAYQNIMILSQQSLRAGFLNLGNNSNVGIHEFVHLVDKTDGAVDGVPETLINKKYVLPWLDLMHYEMQQIMTEHSDIDPYGITNKAEFFAVVSEYFFKNPDQFQGAHPELYKLLSEIFRRRR